jgi:hypothetical protein
MTLTQPSAGMAELIDAYPWDRSPIGSRSSWPLTLSVTVDFALASGFPMLVFWGPELARDLGRDRAAAAGCAGNWRARVG